MIACCDFIFREYEHFNQNKIKTDDAKLLGGEINPLLNGCLNVGEWMKSLIKKGEWE